MKSVLFILCLFSFASFEIYAQPTELTQKVEKVNQLYGEEKILMMLEVAEAYLDSDPIRSLDYIGKVEDMIGKPSKKNYKEGVMLSDAYYIAGQANQNMSEHKDAEKYFLKSFNTASKFDYIYGKDRAEKMLNDLGVSTKNWFSRQLNTLSHLEIGEKVKEVTSDIQVTTKNVTDKEKVVRMDKYIELGNEAHEREDYPQAIAHFREAIDLANELERPNTAINLQVSIANYLEKNNTITQAINYCDSALYFIQLHPSIDAQASLSDSLQNLKSRLKALQQPEVKPIKDDSLQKLKADSLANLEDLISVQIKTQEEGKIKMASLEEVAKRSEQEGDYEKALQFREMYFAMQNKLFKDSLENVARILELEKGRRLQEIELKAQADLLEKEKSTKFLFVTSSILLGMLALVSFYFFRNKKKSHKALQTAYSELEDTLQALKAAQLKLIESEKMASLGQLTAGIAHEINNPINFVTSNISPLKRDIEDLKTFYNAFEQCAANKEITLPKSLVNLKNELDIEFLMEEMNSLLQGIEEGAGRTKNIVESFRSFARLDEEGYKKTDIRESIDASINLLRNRAGNHVHFETNLPEELTIDCQPAKINQVFFHLLHNAVQAILACKENGQGIIEINASNLQESIQIKIKDNGIGISSEIRSKVFDPFFTTRDVGEGKGLGLSITYGIIEEHSGKITFNSKTGKNSFTEFIVSLPEKQNVDTNALLSEKLVDV